MAVLKLKKPIEIDGEKKTAIEYDLDDLTGNDIERANNELAKKGVMVGMVETDQRYHAMLFSMAARIMYEDMNRLSAKDYHRATTEVRNFFLESEDTSGETL